MWSFGWARGPARSRVSAPAQRVRARAPIISPTGSPDRPGLEARKSVPPRRVSLPRQALHCSYPRQFPARQFSPPKCHRWSAFLAPVRPVTRAPTPRAGCPGRPHAPLHATLKSSSLSVAGSHGRGRRLPRRRKTWSSSNVINI